MPRQTPPLASRLTRVSRARAGAAAAPATPTAAPVAASTSSGASSPAGRPSSARRARSRSQVRRRRHVAERQPGEVVRRPCPRRAAAGTPGRCRPARPCAGSRSAARPARRRPRRRRTATKPARAATPALIASEAKWSSSTTSCPPHARRRRSPRRRRRRPSGRRSWARRSTSAAAAARRATPSADTVHDDDEAERGDRLVQLRVAHRVQRGEHAPSRCWSHRWLRSRRRPAGRVVLGGGRARLGRQLELRRHLDAVELGRVQAEDLLLGRGR